LQQADRRDLIKGLVALLALPHAPGAALANEASQRAALEPQRLAALVDTLLPQTATPGGLAAGTDTALQGLMTTWASPQTRGAFAAVLADLDAAAQRTHGQQFSGLDAARRHDLLASFHAAQPANSDWSRLYKVVTTIFFLSQAGATQVLAYEHSPGAWQPSIPLTAATLASAV
jgi:hypothetical protein